MSSNGASDPSTGFSTVEMLVAFAILSLGLGLAVQNVSQASLSLRQAREERQEARLLRRAMSEELPRLLRQFNGSPVEASGEGWTLSAAPLAAGDPRSPLRVTVRLGAARQGRSPAIYTTIVPAPSSARGPESGGL